MKPQYPWACSEECECQPHESTKLHVLNFNGISKCSSEENIKNSNWDNYE